MVNRPKQIGTFAETGVLNAILPYFPRAKRIVLHGSDDQGDIDCGDDADFMIEVKGGKQCVRISDRQLALWMDETDRERDELGKRWGFLVTQRTGYGKPNAHRWWAWVHLGDLASFTGGYYPPGRFAVVRMELRDLLDLLADHDLIPDKDKPATAEPVEEGPETFTHWLDAEVKAAVDAHHDRVYGVPERLEQAGFISILKEGDSATA